MIFDHHRLFCSVIKFQVFLQGIKVKNINSKIAWYLIIAKPHKDAYAEEQLNNQGYEVYRPLAKYMKVQKGKKVKVVDSLFPRYLFISMREGLDDWGPIRSTRGVQGIVKFGVNPAKIDDAVIKGIRAREDDLSEKSINLDRLKEGQFIRINKGPLSGLEGVFTNYNGEQRVMILLDFLGKQTTVTIPSENISPS